MAATGTMDVVGPLPFGVSDRTLPGLLNAALAVRRPGPVTRPATGKASIQSGVRRDTVRPFGGRYRHRPIPACRPRCDVPLGRMQSGFPVTAHRPRHRVAPRSEDVAVLVPTTADRNSDDGYRMLPMHARVFHGSDAMRASDIPAAGHRETDRSRIIFRGGSP